MISRTSRIVIARTTTRLLRGYNGRSGRPRHRRSGRALVQGAGPRRRKPCRRRRRRRRRSRRVRLYPAFPEKQGSPKVPGKKGRRNGRRRRRSRRLHLDRSRPTTAASTTSRPCTRRRVHGKSTRGPIPRASRGRWPSRSGTGSGPRRVVGGNSIVSYASNFASVLKPLAAHCAAWLPYASG